MYDFLGSKIDEMGVNQVAKVLLAVGIIGLIIVISLIVLVIKDTQKKKEELKSKPAPVNQAEQVLDKANFDNLKFNPLNITNP